MWNNSLFFVDIASTSLIFFSLNHLHIVSDSDKQENNYVLFEYKIP